jgi:hypothetical protein
MAYLSLSTANLPDPVIDPAQDASPEDYFNTVLYTGNSSTQSITGVGHQPDFLWFKNRNGTQVHQLFDVVRGVANSLRSNDTDAENIDSPNNRLLSFDSDGFSLGADGNPNGTGNTYVAWSWKANGSGSDSSSYMGGAGTGSSATTSVNTTAGFSITKYYIGSSPDTYKAVPHLLGSVPDMIIVKNLDGAYAFAVNHTAFGSNGYIELNNNTSAAQSDLSYFRTGYFDSTAFTVGGSNQTGSASTNYIAYSFKSVPGFSAFGQYDGNGSTDGPFVYTGFRPAFILIRSSSHARNWIMSDNTRNPYNVVDEQLLPNVSQSVSIGNETDYLSNGFKLRSTASNSNASGYTYAYMAFAENPFKYSNAR